MRSIGLGASFCLAMLAMAPLAKADGLDDAKVAMASLQAGDYDSAISMFGRALQSGALKGDDLELAYSARGEAFLAKRDYWSAIADLDQARRMKPDDLEAQGRLITAIAAVQPAAMVPDQSTNRLLRQLGRSVLKGAAAGLAHGLSQ